MAVGCFTLHCIFGFSFHLCFVLFSLFFCNCFFAIYSGKLCLHPFFKLLWFIEECSEFDPVTPELNIEPVPPVFVDLTLQADEHVN